MKTIYVVFHSLKNEPDYELIDCYETMEGAMKREEELFNRSEVEMAYIFRTVLHE